MITKRVNPDGSITVGIIEDEPKAEQPKAEPKEPKAAPKKTTTKKTSK